MSIMPRRNESGALDRGRGGTSRNGLPRRRRVGSLRTAGPSWGATGISTDHAQQGFGALLRAARERALLSQEELAARAGVSPRTLRYLESGRTRRPRLASVRILADTLGLRGAERDRFERAAVPPAPEAPADAAEPAVDGSAGLPVPAQLPADVSTFVGRTDALRTLSALSGAGGGTGDPGPLLVTAVAGTAGVGKTALAVHWAHSVAAEFPDGQLFVDLHGYSATGPVHPADALARLLRDLGVVPTALPGALEERAALYRTIVAGRRLVVVLDNASSAEQVRPLLPGSATCAVVVTSRSALGGLVARDGARRLVIDVLPGPEARELIGALVGPRAEAEADAIAVLAEQCARLPLALRVAAVLAADRPGATLAELTTEIADEERRLELLDAGEDAASAFSVVVSWSYRQLSPPAALVFRTIGLHPGPHVDAGVVAATAELDAATTADALRELVRASMLTALDGTPGRYWLHDLLRAYAHRTALGSAAPDAVAAATARMYDHYLRTARAAVALVFPASAPGPSERGTTGAAPFATPEEADRWLDAERPVVAGPGFAAPLHVAVGLSQVLWRHLYDGNHTVEALAVHRRALDRAREAADLPGRAVALRGLGSVHWRWGRLERAAELAEDALAASRAAGAARVEAQSLSDSAGIAGQRGDYDTAERRYVAARALHRELGDRPGEAATLLNLGVVHERRGDLDRAADLYREAGAAYAGIGYRLGRAKSLLNLGEILRLRGDDRAEDHYREAERLFERERNPVLRARALNGLGDLHRRQGRVEEAVAAHESALELFRQVDDRIGEGWALDGLGAARVAEGCADAALETYTRAAAIFAEAGDRTGGISASNGLGEALCLGGKPDDAAAHFERARRGAATTGDRFEEVRALVGAGRAALAREDRAAARNHWTAALERAASSGTAQAAEVRDLLDALRRPPAG